MKRLFLKKQNIIALALAAVVAVTGALSYSTSQAAGYIEGNTSNVTINFNWTIFEDLNDVGGETKGQAVITGALYKIGTVESTGNMTSLIDDIAYSSTTTADEMQEMIKKAETAVTAEGAEFDKITIKADSASWTKEEVPNGVYLVMINDVSSPRYTYTFNSFIITAPGNEYVSNKATATSDDWNYDVQADTKYEMTRRMAKLNIVKDLKSFNTQNGDQTFTFKVNYTDDYGIENADMQPVSKVYTMDFSQAGSQTLSDIEVPADIDVTVEETYEGSSYKKVGDVVYTLESEDADSQTITTGHTSADKTLVATFTNDYKPGNNHGTTGVKNHFVKSTDGIWSFDEDNFDSTKDSAADSDIR